MSNEGNQPLLFAVAFSYLWLFMPVLVAAAAWAYWRHVERIVRSSELKAERCRRVILRIAIWHIVPLLVIAIGIGSGTTSTVLDYLHPRDGNVLVWVFHATLLAVWGDVMHWVMFRNGATELVENAVALRLTAGGTLRPREVKVTVAVVTILVAVAFMWLAWTGWFPTVADLRQAVAFSR